ncbi:MAG TPA: Ig-like domain-containing protein [Solirubrobacteraceae bacterium]|nr:Ig-like domain-containing protein [Solirubrobacteraceae bacterium]
MRRALALLSLVGLLAGAGVTASGADFTHSSSSPGNSFVASTNFNTVAVTVTDPGAALHGTVTLQSTATSERGIASVRYQSSPAGAGTWTDACLATTAPFSCDWNSAGVADGMRDLRAIAVDQAGYQQTSATVGSRRVDNTLPAVSLADPGTYLTGTENLTATGSDGNGLASLAIQYRPAGGSWTTLCTGATSPRSCSLNTATLADGSYELRARATDNAGNINDSALTRVVDNTAPTGSIPPPGVLAGTSATVAITAADGTGSGVASVTGQFRASGTTTWMQGCVDTAAPYECTGMDTTSYPDGLYEARAIIADNAGFSTTTATITVRIDNTAPSSATLTNPGTVIKGAVTLNGTAADAGSGVASWTAQYRTSPSGTWTDVCADTTSSYSCSWATTGVTDGTYDLRAVARDQAGNTTTSTVVTPVRVDNTAPTGTDVQTTNASGGTAGRMDANDTIRLTYSEAIAPGSILSGWTGSSQSIRVTVADSGSADKLDFFNSTGGTRLNLVNGTTDLNLAGDYVGSATLWTANMAMSGNTIIVTLVSRSNGTLKTVTGNTTMTWRPNAAALDLAGLATSTTLVTESGTADRDF